MDRVRPARPAGYTMIELITVMLIVGILGAVAGSRFFNNRVYEARAFADQAAVLVRYAQKLAIAQNRPVFVRSTPNGFAVCFNALAPCATSADLAEAPGGVNNGTTATRAFCVNGANNANIDYVANWACLGKPASISIASPVVRNEMATNGFFSFDAAGRPYNRSDNPDTRVSTFTRLTLNFASGSEQASINIEAETGYVF